MSYTLIRIGKIYHLRFTVDARRVQRSTYETTRQRAQFIADRIHREALLRSCAGRLIPSLREIVIEWLAANEPVASRSHVKAVEMFSRLHLGSLADVPVDQLTPELVESERNKYLERHARSSANQFLRVIRLLCHFAVRRGWIHSVPCRVKLLRIQKPKRALLSESIAQAWLAEIDKHGTSRRGVSIAIRLMVGAGLREAECRSCQWQHIDWDRRTLTLTQTKGKETVATPLPDWLLNYLKPLARPFGPIVARPNGKAFASGFCRQAIAAANRACKIDRLTPHSLRRTFAQTLAEQGVPLPSIQAAMRHRDPLTSLNYLERDLTHVERAQHRIARRFGFTVQPGNHGEQVANETARGQHA